MDSVEEKEREQYRSFYFFSVREGEFDESREERSGYVWWWYMRSLVGKWQERRDEKGKARRTGKDKDGTGQDRTGTESSSSLHNKRGQL